MIKWFKQWFTQAICKHEFLLGQCCDRDEFGYVRWPCFKCGKVYEDTYGLAILRHGKCIQKRKIDFENV